MSGHLFLFINNRKNRIKILVWDRTGYLLLYKRPERGTFRIPIEPEAARKHIGVDSGVPTLMLEGLDLTNARRQKRWYRAPRERRTGMRDPARLTSMHA
jgi:transposase